MAIDARQVQTAAASTRELDQWCRIKLFGKCGIHSDAPTRSQTQPAIGVMGYESGACFSFGGRYSSALCTQRRPHRFARKKRHPPVPVRIVALEPEQQVGRTAAGKAFRSRRTCTILPASPDVPGCFKLGSEVTRSACRTPQATRDRLYTTHALRAGSYRDSRKAANPVHKCSAIGFSCAQGLSGDSRRRARPTVRAAGPFRVHLRPAPAARAAGCRPHPRALHPDFSIAATRWRG